VAWHAELILFHVLAVLAAFKSARVISSDRTVGALTAALFALMPLQVGAVAYCSAPQPLAGALILWSFAIAVNRKGPGRLLASVMVYVAALLSYEGAIVLPVLIAVHSLFLGPNAGDKLAQRLRSALGTAMPFLLPTVLYLGARLSVMGPMVGIGNAMTPAEVLMTLPAAIATYALLVVWPFAAGPVHPLAFVTTFKSPRFYVSALLLALLAVVSVVVMIRSPRRRLYAFCIVWIVLTLAPGLVLSKYVPEFTIQDRYLYVSLFGCSLLIASALLAVARAQVLARRLIAAPGLAYGVACVLSLWHVQGYWKDGVAFYSRAVELAPNDALYHKGLAWGFFDRRELNGAEREFMAVCRLDPADAVAAYNLGSVHARMGRDREAVRETAAALERLASPPLGAYIWLAEMYGRFGQELDREAALTRAATLPGGREAVASARAKMLQNGQSRN
jgi:hypothetical protein